MIPLRPLVLLLAATLHAAPVAAVSATATQTPSAPATAAATASPTGSYRPGIITTLAGNSALGLNGPRGLLIDGNGDLLVADTNNHRIRRIASGTGAVTTLAGNGVGAYVGDGSPATEFSLYLPCGLALDQSGAILIADRYNHRVRRLAPGTGIISTLAGSDYGFGGDGGPATSARMWEPSDLAVDGSGNVLIADIMNRRIRRVAAATGIITTFAGTGEGGSSGDGGPATSARLHSPVGLVVDGSNNVLIVDHNSHCIRRVAASTGIITALAGTGVYGFSGDGGPATSAQLAYPGALAVDESGNVLFVDKDNSRVRQIAVNTGFISTLAGIGGSSFGGDGGPATSAGLANPLGLTVDGSNNILVADTGNNRIRLISAPSQRSPLPMPSPTTTPYCFPSLFRPLPRTDLVGSLGGTALAPNQPVTHPSEAACRQACCDAAACDGYTFEAGAARLLGEANCYLLVNVTQLVPSNAMASGLRESALL